ncbi:MAG: SRPBCC domain-containing protein [Bacteroidota bacterium]
MKNEPIVIERKLNATVDEVWKAITDPVVMKNWYFDLPGFKAEVGYEFSFTGGKDENNQYLHLCKITEAVKNKKLSYSWRYDGYEGSSLVTFELTPDGNSTLLKLTHEGLHTFPANPDFAKENFVQGWTEITKALQEFLSKQSV